MLQPESPEEGLWEKHWGWETKAQEGRLYATHAATRFNGWKKTNEGKLHLQLTKSFVMSTPIYY